MKTNSKSLILNIAIYLIIFSFCFPVNVHSQVSSLEAQFLKMGVGPRALAMGEAFSGVADDISAIYWNPAGLVNLKGRELLVQNMVYLFDILHANILYGNRLSEKSGYGVSMDYLWSIDEIRDGSGDPLGNFTSYYSRLIIGYAFRTSDTFSLGFDIEKLASNLYDTLMENFGINIGGLYTLDKFSFGLTLQNIQNNLILFEQNGPLNYTYTPESMPQIFRMGIGYKIVKGSMIAIDYSKANDNNGYYNFGCEYSLMKTLALRFGYILTAKSDELGGLNGMTLGLGMNTKNVCIDFVVTPKGDLGTTYAAALKFLFSEKKQQSFTEK